ncbi:MAG: MFS transporter [Dehalococcoidia bacterium]|nr:MFS transporter [Dehalococcoidia bacterium]
MWTTPELAITRPASPCRLRSTRLSNQQQIPVPPASARAAFYSARLLGQLGQAAFFGGLFWLVARGNNPALGGTVLMAAMMAGSMLFGIPAGALADRLGAGRAALAGAGGRLAIIAGTLVLAFSQAGESLWVLAGAAFLYSVVSQLFCPAELSLVRRVAAHRPSSGHASLMVLQYAGQGLGASLVAGIALFYRSPAVLLVAAVLTYVAVMALVRVVARGTREEALSCRIDRRFILREPLAYFRSQPGAAAAGVFLAFSELVARASAVAIPYYIAHDLDLTTAQAAVLVAPAVLGVAGGLVWASRSLHIHVAHQALRLTLLGTAVSLVALATAGNGLTVAVSWLEPATPVHASAPPLLGVAIAVPVAIVLGACFAVGPVSARTLLTATAPREQQSRVFAMQSVFTDCIVFVPLLLSGVASEFAGAGATFLFLGLVGGAVFVLFETGRLRFAPAAVPAPAAIPAQS